MKRIAVITLAAILATLAVPGWRAPRIRIGFKFKGKSRTSIVRI